MPLNPDQMCCDIELSFVATSLWCILLTYSCGRGGAQRSNRFPLTDADATLQFRYWGCPAKGIEKHLRRKYGLDGK